jgi:signal transduction histidine kinase
MGFNRAMLFLVNDKTLTLQGMLGVGPSSAWEAGEIWARLGNKPVNFRDWSITDADMMAQKESAFNRSVKSMRISYEDETSVFAAAVREKRAISVLDAELEVGPDISNAFGVREFAVVPLTAKDRVISLVVVDNKYTGRTVRHEDLRLLIMFANQAGLAMESAMAYSNLEHANRELKETQDRLILSEKLAALGEMAASIAHEIKNPLTVIGGFATRLAKTEGEGDTGRYAKIIRDEAKRLEKILGEVLDFSREMRPNIQPVNINDVLENTLAMYEEDFREKSLKVRKNLFPEPLVVMADQQQLKQALINVLSNSEQAMENSGGKEIYFRTWVDRDAGRAVIEVTDTGGGIPPEVMQNIFNPFFTTKVKGTGLGLAITNKIAKSHGGDVEVVNREGSGVTFRIKLPYRENAPAG